MSLVQITGLSFTYDASPDPVFEHLTLQFDTSWRLGVTGRNGRGKTTLLRLLAKQYAYTGRINGLDKALFFPPKLTCTNRVSFEVAQALSPDMLPWQYKRECGLLGLAEETLLRPFDTLSKGEQTKALLAALFLQAGAYPLIDEPTNHLDAEGRRLTAAYLKKQPGFLLVSHDRAFLDACTDHTLSFNKTGVQICQGNFSVFFAEKQKQDAYEQAQNDKLRGEARRLQEAAGRTAVWSAKTENGKKAGRDTPSGLRPDRGHIGHKAAKLMKQAKIMEHRRNTALEKTRSLLRNIETAEPLHLPGLPFAGKAVLTVTRAIPAHDGKAVCAPVTFTLACGERIALCGGNGCGKTSLLELIARRQTPFSGGLCLAGGVIISYLPQATGFLKGTLSDFIRKYALDESLFKALLRKLDFPRAQFTQMLENYSEGQKKKVLLARSLCTPAHLYLWDEPLNYIDLYSRMQLEQLVCESPAALLFTEHDAAFTGAAATKTVQLFRPHP